MAIMAARLTIVASPQQQSVKNKSLNFQKRKLNIKPQAKPDESSTLEAIFKNQSEILSARKNERE